jgi:hypothetical protein
VGFDDEKVTSKIAFFTFCPHMAHLITTLGLKDDLKT